MIAVITLALLVVGFIFTSLNPITRFQQYRITGWSLYCQLFFWGVFISLLGIAVLYICKIIDLRQKSLIFESIESHFDIIRSFLEIENISCNFVLWIFCSVVLSFLLGEYCNVLPYFKTIAIKRICKANDLKNKFYEATKPIKLVQITLDTRKVYVGLVLRSKDEFSYKDKEYIEIVPYKSGFREDKTLSIHFTNDYSFVYYDLMKRKKMYVFERAERIFCKKAFSRICFKCKYSRKQSKLNIEVRQFMKRFSVVIPMDDIISASFFEVSAYSSINGNIDRNGNC